MAGECKQFATSPTCRSRQAPSSSTASVLPSWGDVRAAALRVQPVPYSHSWFTSGGDTRWLPLHLLHPGVWRSFDILWSLNRLRGDDTSAASFIAEKGYRGRARELAQLTLTAHLPGGVEEVGVRGLAADGVLRLEEGVNHRIIDGYDLLAQHVATGLDIRFGCKVAKIAWGTGGVEITLQDGRTFSGRVAITTLPHGVLASGIVAFEPSLPESKIDAIKRIATGPVAKVLLCFDERFWPRQMAQLICGTGPITLFIGRHLSAPMDRPCSSLTPPAPSAPTVRGRPRRRC